MYNGSSSTLAGLQFRNTPSSRAFFPNKTEYVNSQICNMITEINQSKTLINQFLCSCSCKFDCRKCNSDQKWNSDKSRCECKNPTIRHECKKDQVGNPITCACECGYDKDCEIDKYLKRLHLREESY